MMWLLSPWASNTYTVTFDSSGGSAVSSQTVGEGSTASEPANPTKMMDVAAGLYKGAPEGFDCTFIGWYLNGSPYSFNTPVTEDITLIAQWTEPANPPALIAYDLVPANNVDAASAHVNSYSAPSYTLLLDADKPILAGNLLMPSQNSNLTIIGKGSMRTIQYNGPTTASLFNIQNSSASLTLGNNITLRGIDNGTQALVQVAGTFTMLAGSKITGHTTSSQNGTVWVQGGTFVMKGGEIIGNKNTSDSSTPPGGLFASGTIEISGGTIRGNTNRHNTGGADTNPADVTLDVSSLLTLSGNAAIGALMLIATNEDNNASIAINQAYTGSATLNLYGVGGSTSQVVSLWEYKAVIKGGSGYAPTAGDISRFNLGQIFGSTFIGGRSITPDYWIGTSGADMGILTKDWNFQLYSGSATPLAQNLVLATDDIAAAFTRARTPAGTYTMVVANRTVTGDNQTLYTASNLTIIGKGASSAIQYNGAAGNALFTVNNASASLTLGNNITLRGIPNGEQALVDVQNGTLTMLAGSKITGHTYDTIMTSVGTVQVTSNGTFVMYGGEIIGNKTTSTSGSASGGLYVSGNARISGGTISGNTSNYAPGHQADISISRNADSFTLSGDAIIGVLTLEATGANNNSSITIDQAYTGRTAALNLYGNNTIANVIGWWTAANTTVIRGTTAFIPGAIGKITLGQFLCNNAADARSIRDADCSIGTSGDNIGKLLRTFTLPLTNIADIEPYLRSQSVDPVQLRLNIPLGNMEADNNATWRGILDAIAAAGKNVDLDLSACAMTGTVFNPDYTVSAGKDKIVSLTLPNGAESTLDSNGWDAVFKHFANLKSLSGTRLKTLGRCAFYEMNPLALTSLPEGLTTIGEEAFDGCTNLAWTSLPAGVTTIGNFAFYHCTNLALDSLPSGLTSIGANAFDGCENLALKNSLPSGLKILGVSAFFNCTNLALTSLPAGLTSIGGSTFQGCSGLTEMTLHADITSIGNAAFSGCTSLTIVIFEGTIVDANFGNMNPFNGDLRTKYFAPAPDGGPGTYTRSGNTWTKL